MINFNLSKKILITYFITKKLLESNQEKTKGRNSTLPSFKNIIEVKHFLPGRIRMYTPKLVNNQKDKKHLINQLLGIDGIDKIEINTITGSLLILYDINKVECSILYSAIIRLLDLEQYIDRNEKPLILREIHEISKALNRGMYEKTNGIIDIKTLISLSLVFIALKEYYSNSNINKPGVYTLLWWAYSSLSWKGGE